MPRVADGRFGSANWLRLDAVLFLPPGIDIRDAYNSQQDPSRTNSTGDTVIVNGVSDSNKTAYYVVFVEVIARGPRTPTCGPTWTASRPTPGPRLHLTNIPRHHVNSP